MQVTRVTGYIDGMNFYEASKNKQWYPAGWCNWRETMLEYCPNSVVTIKYFTTEYSGRDQKRADRQKLHLLAMEEVAKANIIKGSLRKRDLICPECKELLTCRTPRCRCSERLAEKMTDVNIALHLFEDALDGKFDRAYLVSADVDLIPAVQRVVERFGDMRDMRVHVLRPPDVRSASDFADLQRRYPDHVEVRDLELRKLRRFPDDLPKRWNMTLPEHWRADAGPRPPHPGHENPPPAKRPKGGPTPWYEESREYGSAPHGPRRK